MMKTKKLLRPVAISVVFMGLLLGAAVAKADSVVVVSAKSSVGNLTSDQVGQLFLGKAASFPNGEAAVPIDQADGTVKDVFYSKVTGKDSAQLRAYWSQLIFTGKAKPPKSVADSSEVKKLISANPNMIGYIDKGAVDASVKVVFAP
jgi:ABC-type phosphate transport system substrate-binding protein